MGGSSDDTVYSFFKGNEWKVLRLHQHIHQEEVEGSRQALFTLQGTPL